MRYDVSPGKMLRSSGWMQMVAWTVPVVLGTRAKPCHGVAKHASRGLLSVVQAVCFDVVSAFSAVLTLCLQITARDENFLVVGSTGPSLSNYAMLSQPASVNIPNSYSVRPTVARHP